MTFQEPFSGAYLHKLFLHCSIFKVHAFTARLLGGSSLILPRGYPLVKNNFPSFEEFCSPGNISGPLIGCLANIPPEVPLCQHFFDAFLQKNIAAKSCGFKAAKGTKLRRRMGNFNNCPYAAPSSGRTLPSDDGIRSRRCCRCRAGAPVRR